MLFLINFVLLSFVLPNVSAETIGVLPSLYIEKHVRDDQPEYVLKIKLESTSNAQERYVLKVVAPSIELKMPDLKERYDIDIKPGDSEIISLNIEPVNEGRGLISVALYGYNKRNELDVSSARTWSFDCSVSRDDTGKFLIYVSADSNESPVDLENKEDADIGSAIYDNDSDIKIVVNEDNRNNNFLRYILFLLSFFILGYLIYKIVKED